MKILKKIINLFTDSEKNINHNNMVSVQTDIKTNIIKIADLCSINLTTGLIEIYKPIRIVSNENISIKSDKHIMLSTSKSGEIERPGYTYSIWLNSEVDENENPIKTEFFIDQWGNSVLMEAKYDNEGNLIVPEGYFLPPTGNDNCNH